MSGIGFGPGELVSGVVLSGVDDVVIPEAVGVDWVDPHELSSKAAADPMMMGANRCIPLRIGGWAARYSFPGGRVGDCLSRHLWQMCDNTRVSAPAGSGGIVSVRHAMKASGRTSRAPSGPRPVASAQ